MRNSKTFTALAIAAAALTLPACSGHAVSGEPTAAPSSVTATTAADTTIAVPDTAGAFFEFVVNDAVSHWRDAGVDMGTMKTAAVDGGLSCSMHRPAKEALAAFCWTWDDASDAARYIIYDPAEITKLYGDGTLPEKDAVVYTASHEVGHSAFEAKTTLDTDGDANKGRRESHADCYAGAYMRSLDLSQPRAEAAVRRAMTAAGVNDEIASWRVKNMNAGYEKSGDDPAAWCAE